jgi:hypothetical protein
MPESVYYFFKGILLDDAAKKTPTYQNLKSSAFPTIDEIDSRAGAPAYSVWDHTREVCHDGLYGSTQRK